MRATIVIDVDALAASVQDHPRRREAMAALGVLRTFGLTRIPCEVELEASMPSVWTDPPLSGDPTPVLTVAGPAPDYASVVDPAAAPSSRPRKRKA